MGSVYSTRFADVDLSGLTGAQTLFSVPGGHTAVVRSWTAYKSGSGAGLAFWKLGSAYAHKMAPAGDETFEGNDTRWVFEAGEDVVFFVSSGNWFVTAHGYLLVD